jgi:hypothetical protein
MNSLRSAPRATVLRLSSFSTDGWIVAGMATRAWVPETAHPAMQATIKKATLAANNPLLPSEFSRPLT